MVQPSRLPSPVKCELGNHSGNFSIYRVKAGDRWGCAGCITAGLGRVPAFLKPGV